MAGVDLGTAIRARSALCPPHLPWAEPVCSMAEADLGIAVGARCALHHGLSQCAQWLKPTLASPSEHAPHRFPPASHGLSRYAQWLKPTLASPLEHAAHC